MATETLRERGPMSTTGLRHLPGRWHANDQTHAVELVRQICAAAPLRRPHTPSGRPMGVQITSSGRAAWWSSTGAGYRYLDTQPDGRPLPAAPPWILEQASLAAAYAGVEGFTPDSVLINWYEPGVALSTHRDESEDDLEAPIVSFSLGAATGFWLRGEERESSVSARLVLESGDALVMAQPCRNWYHEVREVPAGRTLLFNPLRSPGRISILVRKVR